MKRLATFAAVSLAALLVASCGTSNNSSFCPDLATDAVLPAPIFTPGGLWDVTYTVAATGGATIGSIQYRDTAGVLITVNSPALPWVYTMTGKPAGTRVTVSASASAPPGWVTVDVDAVTGPSGARETQSWGDACGDLPVL